jgi:hypothetical protein
VEADLIMHYNGTRLTDLRLYRSGGALSFRLLGTLVRMLPPEAAVWRAIGADHLSRSEHYLAGLWELWAEQGHPDRPGPTADQAQTKRPASRRGKPPGGDWSKKLLDHQKRYAERTAS